MDCKKEKISASELTYRTATMDDYDDFYKIKCDPENVKWSGFASVPDYDKMKEWFRQQLGCSKRSIYLCYLNGDVCGFFYLDKVSDEEFEAASSGVISKYTGRGIGTMLVQKRIDITKELGAKTLTTWIADENPRSWKRFKKCGFKQTNTQDIRSIGGGIQIFHKWIISLTK